MSTFVGPVLFLCKLSVVVFSCHVVLCLSELNHVVLKTNFTDLGHAVINKWFWLLMPSVWCFSDRNGLISHLLIIIFSRYNCSVALSCRSELPLCDFQDQVSSTQRASSPVWHNYLLLWTHLLSCSNPFPLIWTMFDTHHVPHTQRRRPYVLQWMWKCGLISPGWELFYLLCCVIVVISVSIMHDKKTGFF